MNTFSNAGQPMATVNPTTYFSKTFTAFKLIRHQAFVLCTGLLLLLLTLGSANAQTTLAAGDIAIIGNNRLVAANPYELAIVTLVDISPSTTIYISDFPYANNSSGFVNTTNTSEGAIAWTTTALIPKGSVYLIKINAATTTPVVSGLPGTVSVSGWTSGSTGSTPAPAGGENWFIYQGTSATAPTTFVFGWINYFTTAQGAANSWLSSGTQVATNTSTSELPPGLTNGSTAISLAWNTANGGNHGDNNVYTGTTSGTRAQILSAIASTTNWSYDETITYKLTSAANGTTTRASNPYFTSFTLTSLGNYEFFESATANAKNVTNATTGLNFTLGNKLAIQNYAGYGVQAANSPSATVGSNFYVGNDGNTGASQVNSITSTNKALFTVKSIWVYPSSDALGSSPTNNGSITFTGKKNGVQQFTFTKSSGFQTSVSLGTNYNGFTLVDFSVGTDNSNILVDQLEITLGGSFQYLAMDNFAFTATPGITNTAATSVTSTTATLNSGVNPSASAVSSISFDYSTSSTLASGVTNVAASPASLGSANTATAVSANITGLLASTTYYYRAKATNAIGTNDNSAILSFTTSAPSGVLLSTSPTLHFANSTGFSDNIAEDGEGGSTSITDINIQTYPINSSAVKITGSPLTYYDNNSSGWTGYPGIISYGDINAFYGWVIKSSNGNNFSLASLNFLDWGDQTGKTFKIEAFDGGVTKGSLSFVGNTTTAFKALSQTSGVPALVLPAAFGNVDEVRIYQANGASSYIALNDIKVGTAVAASAPTASAAAQTNVACNGGTTGSATVGVTGGTAPYTYSWAPSGGTQATATGLAAGTYTVTVTDANSLQATQSFTITQPTAISLATGSQTNIACFGGSTGAASVTPSGGTAPYTYSWSPAGGTAATTTGRSEGSYTVTVTDANGCTATRTFTITQPSALAVTPASQTNVAVFGAATGAASINVPTGGTPSYTYDWSPGTPTGDGTRNITGLTAGTYTVTVTDANGCMTTQSFTITQSTSISLATGSQTNIACNGGSTGSASVTPSGGAAPYTYSWSPMGGTAATATSLPAGTYTVTVTDANNATATRSFTITQPTAISLATGSQTNIACFGGSTGAASVTPTGGTAPYTYSWSPAGGTAATATGLTAGSYTVTVTDANGCTATRNFTLTQPASVVSGTRVVTNISCFGGTNGSINLTPTGGTGPYTFNWGGGVTTEDRVGLAAGTYSVTITDANGCTGTVSGITITQPASVVSGTTVVTNISCFGGTNGSINLTPTGGTGPYTFNWGGGVTTEDRTSLAAGTYSVTITDANGCTGTVSGITITQPASVVSGTRVVTNISCFGGTNGSINLTPTGGTGPYTFNWGGGVTTEDRVGLAAGTYSVTITDANGCTSTVSGITITQPAAALTASTSTVSVSTFGGANGSATVSVSGGTPGYTYSWAPTGGTAATASGLSAGSYTVTVTDANGCQITRTVTVSEPTVVTSVTSTATNATYKLGDIIPIQVTFSSPVSVTGTPTLTLNTGEIVDFASGAGTSTLTFNYTIGSVQTADLDYASTTSLALSGGTIKDATTVNAILTLASPGSAGSLGANKALVIDGILPTVASINRVQASPNNFNSVDYTVTFSEAVTGVGVSDFTVSTTGGVTASIASLNGSGSSYTVTLNSVVGTGTVKLNFNASGTGVSDLAGNSIGGGYTNAQVYDIDQTPLITVAGTLTALNTVYGTASATTSFMVSGVNIAGGISINAPTGFEVSTNATTGFANQLTVGTNGAVATTTVYVRLKASAGVVASPYSGNLTLTSAGAITRTLATVSSTVNTKNITLTLNAAPLITKTYDAGTSATLVAANYSLAGIVGTDVVTVSGTASYSSKLIGTGKTVTANTFVLAGADKDNYTLTTTSATTTGNITARDLTLTLNAAPLIAKTYDAGTSATLVAGNYSLAGIQGADAVTVSGTATYNNKLIGTGKTVTANAFVLAGADKDNYTLSTTSATTIGNITAKELTLTLNATPLITKTYNALTGATLVAGNYNLAGIQGADAVTVSGTANYANKTIGTGKMVSATTFVLAGADKDNYTLTTTSATTTGNITARDLTLTLNASPLITKTYDAGTSATLVAGNYSLAGIQGTDAVTVSGTANYNTKLIGNGKTVTANTFVLAGADKDNYVLTTASATTTGNITAKDLTLTLNATPLITKTYDGNTTATLVAGNYSLSGIQGADAVTVSGSATYDTKAAGTGKTVTATNFVLAGTDQSNYTLVTTTANTTGEILVKNIVITAEAKTKVYGENDPTFTYTFAPQLITGDTFVGTLNRASGQNVGTYAIGLGSLAVNANYQLTIVPANLTITKKELTLYITSKTKTYGDADPVLTYDFTGTLPYGDIFTGQLSRVAGEQVGQYTINPGTVVLNNNYNLAYSSGILTITPRSLSVTANAGSKTYGNADPQLTYTVDAGLVAGDVLSGTLTRATGELAGTYAISQGSLGGNGNYTISFTGNSFTINKRPLMITADNKLKSVGSDNPVLTASYAGFVNGESSAVLTIQPLLSTTALTNSPKGSYPITIGGASAANYTIGYQSGTLTVVEALTTDIVMTSTPVYEGITIGTGFGQLRSVSDNPTATFTYSLITGTGSTDNALFRISGNFVQVASALDYETKANYSIRVRSADQFGVTYEKVFVINLIDVNEAPTLNAIADRSICTTTADQVINLTGISAGPDAGQTPLLSVSSNNPAMFSSLTVSLGTGGSGTLTYKLAPGALGTATISVVVNDNGGVAFGGVQTVIQRFNLAVNALPTVAIASNKGLNLFKGEPAALTATGGVTYTWANADGIVSGQNTAVLNVTPNQTTTYTVTATNASGCTQTASITLNVTSFPVEEGVTAKATNIMSPNGDGINDNWIVEDIDKYPNNSVRIVDRAGRMVYYKEKYDNTWDATLRGVPLAEGTYYYIIDFGDGKTLKKGFISILRKK